MNVHFPVVATIKRDEYGEQAEVLCGAVGSYFSADLDAVTCAECVALVKS